MVIAVALAAHDTSGALKKIEIERRAIGEHDVDIKIHYCGIVSPSNFDGGSSFLIHLRIPHARVFGSVTRTFTSYVPNGQCQASIPWSLAMR